MSVNKIIFAGIIVAVAFMNVPAILLAADATAPATQVSDHDSHTVPGKLYVDTGLATKENVINATNNLSGKMYDATNTLSQKLDTKADSSSLAAVATSGSYNDLTDIPNSSIATLYEIRTTQGTSVATGGYIELDMDNINFRLIKQSTAAYWAARITNNTGATMRASSRMIHLYTGGQFDSDAANLAPGGQLNPDNESGDIGYSGQDVAMITFADWTNMHMYRWTLTVDGGNAMMTLEKLH
jgi:hypothetical protein